MGILKHAILPGFALMHAGCVLACKDLKSWAGTVAADKVISEEDNKSARQNHMLGGLRAFNLAMAFLCTVGFLKESSHFRKEIVIGECIFFSAVTADAYRLGLKWYIPGLQAALAAIGAAINSMEPGIFTKDKRT